MVRSRVRTSLKAFQEAVDSKDKQRAEQQYRSFVRQIDKAVTKGVLHKNTAARKKSRMNKVLQTLGLS